MYLFENQEATGQSFTKKSSLNMKNFSQVKIGGSDDIKALYESEARLKLNYQKVKIQISNKCTNPLPPTHNKPSIDPKIEYVHRAP